MKKNYLAFLCLFGTLAVFAQDTKTLWQKDISSSTQDFLSGLATTIDGQFLVSGSSIASPNPSKGGETSSQSNNGYDYHILKLDQQGQKVWEKYFGGTKHDYLAASVATQEGGFLLAGTSYSNQSGDKTENNMGASDIWLVRLNENGEELWQKTLGTKSNDDASSVVQTTDEGFFVAGNINENKKLFGSKDVFVSKLDKTGKLINTTIFGSKSLDEVTDMAPTSDGGAILAIYSTSGKSENLNYSADNNSNENNSPANQNGKTASELISTTKTFIGKSEGNFGNGDYWIVKLDKNASVEWQKTFGGKEDDQPKTIAFTENGYVIAGESRSQPSGNKKGNIEEGTDIWILNLDKSGNEIWQKSYNFGNRDVAMSLDVIRKTNKDNFSEDKGFLLGGYTQAEGKVKSDDETFWMLYIDKNGKEVWRKYVEGKEKKQEERLVSAILSRDGSYVLAGTSAEELGKENWKIVKLLDSDVEDLIDSKNIQIYPNPVKDYCYVEIGLDFENADLYLYDMAGKVIQQLQTKNKITKINTGKLPQGIYVVSAITSENKKLSTKIVKE
ncbi:MAG: T9SS type A sorting domain-containing protein [Bergeyella sp.]